MNMRDLLGPDDKDHCMCKNCDWVGTYGECTKKEVNTSASAWRSLAGREGWEWFCPRCKWMVDSHYTKMS